MLYSIQVRILYFNLNWMLRISHEIPWTLEKMVSTVTSSMDVTAHKNRKLFILAYSTKSFCFVSS